MFINSDERQKATLTLRLNASHEPLPNISPEGAISNRPLRGLKVGAIPAEHTRVALAKHLLPLGVYKNDVKVGVYKNLPIYTAKTSVAIRDIRGEAKQHTKKGNKK